MVRENCFTIDVLHESDGIQNNSIIVKMSNYESVGRAFESLQAHQ